MKKKQESTATDRRVSFYINDGDGRIWFSRKDGCLTHGEILTYNKGAIRCLKSMAEEKPDSIVVLSEEGELPFHCVVDASVSYNYNVGSGLWLWQLSTLVPDEEETEECEE